jgi:co-chaperonin GroES (HSP10)
MPINKDKKLNNIIVVGDRVLIKPKTTDEKTGSGLYLPAYIQEKEPVRSGYVMKVGPGYPIPFPTDEEETWKKQDSATKYVPLQAKVGDLAIFIQKGTVEIMIELEKYFIVPQSNILLLEREEDV